MNEAETRAEHIDPALKAAGWGVVEGAASCVSILPPSDASKDSADAEKC
jgi:type I site-specific restriction endonuclease